MDKQNKDIQALNEIEWGVAMSKYDPLWKWINKNKTDDFKLTFAEIENIAGVPIDHSFLTFKRKLLGCLSQPDSRRTWYATRG